MLAETEKLLGTLEVITSNLTGFHETLSGSYETFFWDVSLQGNFNLWNLMVTEEYIQPTNIESVIQGWLQEEQNRSIAPRDKYLLEEPNPETFIDEATKPVRAEKYYLLLQILKNNLQQLQGFSYCLNKSQSHFYGLIGKFKEDGWIAISTSMPHRYRFPHWLSASDFDIKIENLYKDLFGIKFEIEKIIEQLPILKFAIPYPAGYGYTYDYKLCCGVASTKSASLVQAMLEAKTLHLRKFQDLSPDYDQYYYYDDYRRKTQQVLSKFFRQYFLDVRVYHLTLFDTDHTYILGQVAGADWLGVRVSRRYQYNP